MATPSVPQSDRLQLAYAARYLFIRRLMLAYLMRHGEFEFSLN